ncbi:MAG: Hsp33 family molecular chaperone [Clostridium sp. SCN 57-10]|nr:MAG: Hsp33 family molecular chaperone [Clostridium sp. SCN 57-10]
MKETRDILIRGMTADGFIRFCAVQTRGIVERARGIHHMLPLATAALGRALTAASMLGDDIKDEAGSVTLQIRGGGPLGAITAVSDAGGNVRGYLQNPAVELPLRADGKLDVGGGVGTDGVLTVIRDIGAGEPFSGKVALRSGEIAEDIAAYFAESEQLPTACALGVLVDRDGSVLCSGGYLLQLMPGAPEAQIALLEESIAAVGSITTRLHEGMDIEGLIARIFKEIPYSVMKRHEVAYECKCTREKVERALVSMGKTELAALAAEQETAHVTCQFCDEVYSFSREELEALVK